MLGVNQLDFLNYTTAFKGNYRKGPHKLRALLNTPTQGQEFAKNLGGVSVVFGVPLDQPDRNSDELYAILTGSKWCDQAVETWLHGFYEFDTLDQLLSDVAVCKEIAGSKFIYRAVGASGVVVGKTIVRLAGLDPTGYADMTAVAASSAAMRSVAASSTAMAAIWQSTTAINAVKNNSTAWATFTGATSAVMGKTVAILAGLNPASFADMAAVAASSTAMAAIIASATALNAVVASSTAMKAVAASSTAMAAVAASSTAMAAVAASSVARTAVTNSETAKTALAASPLKTTVTKGGGNAWETRTIRNGKGWLISCYNANSGGEAGSTWYKIDGTQTNQAAGTTTVGKFFLTSLSIYWWSSTSTITYIPIA